MVTVDAGIAINSATAQLTTRGAGSTLGSLIVCIFTAGAGGTVSISDEPGGANARVIVPANTALGCYHIPMNAISKTSDWRVSTGAGATVTAFVGL